MIEIHILHFILGVILFFIINWIGRHSYSVGYMQISMFLKVEEAPAFNFLFRIISPIVYLFIISAILYKIGLDRFVVNVYFISIYYVLFRLIFNLLTNRGLLMNWYRQSLYWISIIAISYFSYTEIIYKKENILPDFETVSNELWIIILIFLFHTLNQIRISSDKTIQRKENYLKSRLSHFKEKYGDLVNDKITNDKLKSIIYALMIYEDFNRPKAARIIENARFKLTGKKHSLGLMQIQTSEFINDRKSVELGIEKVKNTYTKSLKKMGLDKDETIYTLLPNAYYKEITLESTIISDYNKDDSYVYEVRELLEKIFELNKSDNKKYLFPQYNGEKPKYFSNEEE
jgi:antitoxin component of RelBE/YafQ-DinJ toxin-antitoxin module